MITTILQGGLGNQLFQYFMGMATARRLGVELQLDVSLLQHDRKRQYNLGLFHNIKEKLVTGSVATVCERGLPYDPELVDSIKDGDVLRGYWQCEDYFQSQLAPHQIFERLQIGSVTEANDVLTVKRIVDVGEDSTFLSIRRGDYLQFQDYHGVLPIDYYRQALSRIYGITGRLPRVFVFSDDHDWCQTELPALLQYPFEVVGSKNLTTATHLGREDFDLYLMSLCHNAVLANSSFAWWGAWLGDFQQRKREVIAPKQWFTTTAVDSSTIVPKRWTQI